MKKILITFFVFSGMAGVYAQGSSDPGLGSMGSLQAGQVKHETGRSTAALGVGVASAEKEVMIISPEAQIKIANEKGYFEFRLPFHAISGDLAKNQGIGDLKASYTFPIKMKSKDISLQATAGFRVGLASANDAEVGKPLPMVYQTSLGTTDVVLGLSMKWSKYLNVVLAAQQPVLQYNNNGYEKANYRSNDTGFFASRKLKRNGDVMLRIEGQYDFNNMGVTAGPALMYHIMDDKYETSTGTKTTITGSAGMTLNVNAGFYYKAKSWMADLNIGLPVMERDMRPDGLSRTWIAVPRIIFFL